MSSTILLEGEPVAETVRAETEAELDRLRGVTPTLGTVLMNDDPAAQTFMDRKHELCGAAGVETERIDVPVDAPASALYEAIDRLASDDAISALFVQTPLPEHVSPTAVRDRVPASKDIDCFAHENLGQLVAGDPRIVPPTTAAVLRLLGAYEIPLASKDIVIVGRTTVICKPLAHRLLARDATVTVCHSRTRDLPEKTRTADVLVTAAGEPRLIDATMVSDGVSVVDISVNRVETDSGDEVVGDVDFASVRERATAITPVPGGVGPLTLAFILRNVVAVTARHAGSGE